tara:strand:- start:18 stop:422 length:405 start_codon:yes stop_codon:yes gene_type:complete
MIQYDHPVKVYYKDVDQMGIVYYSRYFEYFEEARTELLNSIGLDVTSIENQGIQLPVIESHCEYSKGAKFEQDLIIKTTILDIPKARLKIDYNVYKDHSNELLVKGYTVHAFMNQSGRAIRIPSLVLNTIQDNM